MVDPVEVEERPAGEQDKRAVRAQLITIIGAAVILAFVGVWGWVLILVWTQVPPPGSSTIALGNALVVTAGTLTTTVGTLTAGALGFTIADVKKKESLEVTVVNVGKQLSVPTAWAIVAYLLVGLAVLVTWIAREGVAPELIVTFGFSILGWLVGGAGAAFRDPEA